MQINLITTEDHLEFRSELIRGFQKVLMQGLPLRGKNDELKISPAGKLLKVAPGTFKQMRKRGT